MKISICFVLFAFVPSSLAESPNDSGAEKHGLRKSANQAASVNVEPQPDMKDPTLDRDLVVTLPASADYLFYGPTLVTSDMTDAVTSLGMTWASADATQFNAMTKADFQKYKAIVFAEPHCVYDTSPIDGAMSSRAVWSSAVTGNVVVLGSDEVYHWEWGGSKVATNGLAYVAGAAGKTGLYFSLGCYYAFAAPSTPVTILDKIGDFQTTGASCYDDAHIVATNPVTNGLTDADIANWGCSLHEVLNSYPYSFIPLAIARNLGTTSFPDGSVGTPYIVARDACLATTYWLWDPATDTVLYELKNGGSYNIPKSYNIEVRPCPYPVKMPVSLRLKNSTGAVIRGQDEYYAPFYVWGDETKTGDVWANKKPLPKGTYSINTKVDGKTQYFTFTQTGTGK